MNDAARNPDSDNLEIFMQSVSKPLPVAARSVVHPTKSLFKPADGFVWTNSAATDIKARFAAIRAEQQQKELTT